MDWPPKEYEIDCPDDTVFSGLVKTASSVSGRQTSVLQDTT